MNRFGGWIPCENPKAFQWAEFRYKNVGNTFGKNEETISGDDFHPMEGIRVIGKKKIIGDKFDTEDADWLIWEKSTNGVIRLCQMKGGCWSPVREVARAPQTIVIDNDTETIHLFLRCCHRPRRYRGGAQAACRPPQKAAGTVNRARTRAALTSGAPSPRFIAAPAARRVRPLFRVSSQQSGKRVMHSPRFD